MNKMFKVLGLVLILVVCFSLPAFAGALDWVDPSTGDISQMQHLGNRIIGILQFIAIIVAIAVLLFVGIKFLLASPSEKAGIKGMLIPYVIGAIIIFAAVPILEIIESFTKGM